MDWMDELPWLQTLFVYMWTRECCLCITLNLQTDLLYVRNQIWNDSVGLCNFPKGRLQHMYKWHIMRIAWFLWKVFFGLAWFMNFHSCQASRLVALTRPLLSTLHVARQCDRCYSTRSTLRLGETHRLVINVVRILKSSPGSEVQTTQRTASELSLYLSSFSWFSF